MRARLPVLLGVAGGSGSGKTYLARRIQRDVGEAGVAVLSMDQYFRTLSPEERTEPRDINFDHPSHIDTDALARDLAALRRGEAIMAPIYDFRTQVQTPAAVPVAAAPVIVVEGLFILREPVVDHFDLTVFLDVDADQRLIGRLLRDQSERDGDLRWSIDRYQRFVRPGYDTFVAPTRNRADVVVDFTYRRLFFQELLVGMVRGYVLDGAELRGLIQRIRGDQWRPGVQPREAREAPPPPHEIAPDAAPTLFVADNPQRPPEDGA
ncbi:MAG: hypothetical protein R3B09_05245 [Nannocystaceae bacterium]